MYTHRAEQSCSVWRWKEYVISVYFPAFLLSRCEKINHSSLSVIIRFYIFRRNKQKIFNNKLQHQQRLDYLRLPLKFSSLVRRSTINTRPRVYSISIPSRSNKGKYSLGTWYTALKVSTKMGYVGLNAAMSALATIENRASRTFMLSDSNIGHGDDSAATDKIRMWTLVPFQ